MRRRRSLGLTPARDSWLSGKREFGRCEYRYGAHSLDFEDDSITDQNIHSMFTDVMVLVGDIHFNFCLRLHATENAAHATTHVCRLIPGSRVSGGCELPSRRQ